MRVGEIELLLLGGLSQQFFQGGFCGFRRHFCGFAENGLFRYFPEGPVQQLILRVTAAGFGKFTLCDGNRLLIIWCRDMSGLMDGNVIPIIAQITGKAMNAFLRFREIGVALDEDLALF